MFLLPGGSTVTTGEQNFYQDIVDAGLTGNLKMVLDAGSINAGAGQSFLDLSGNGYDMFRGPDGSATAADPTYNGTLGNLSSSEYYSFDGGDYFRYDSSNETWMENLHKNNAAFTFLFWFRTPTTIGGNVGSMFGTGEGLNSNARGIGCNWGQAAAARVTFNCSAAPGQPLQLTVDTAFADATIYLWGITIDEATGSGGGFFYRNGAYDQSGSSDTWDATYTSPNAGAAAYTWEIFASGNIHSPMLTGARLYGVMIWEGGVLSKANCDTLWDAQKGRFGL